MSVLNQVIHEQIAKMPSLQRLELDLENCSQFNEQERDDLIEPLFTRDDYIFTQLAFYNAPEWVHQRILKCFEQDAPGAARITGLLVNHLNNQSFSDFANSSVISNLSEKYLSKDFQIRSWQTKGWAQDIAIEESAAGDSDATTHLKELDAYGYKGFDLKQMRALLGDESSTIQLPLLTRVYLDSLDEQSMAYFFERAPHVLPHLRMLHIKWCDLPVLEKAPVWPSLEQFTVQVLSSTKSATSQLLSDNAFPSLTALSLEGDSQTFAAFLQLYLSWSTLEKVRINTSGVALVDAFDASLKAGVFDAFQEANLCWSAGERYHDPSEAPAIVSRLQDASIPLVARRQLMDGYVSSHIERPLLYKFLKEMGADVTTKTKLGELQKIYDATIPEALNRSVEFSDLDRWFYR